MAVVVHGQTDRPALYACLAQPATKPASDEEPQHPDAQAERPAGHGTAPPRRTGVKPAPVAGSHLCQVAARFEFGLISVWRRVAPLPLTPTRCCPSSAPRASSRGSGAVAGLRPLSPRTRAQAPHPARASAVPVTPRRSSGDVRRWRPRARRLTSPPHCSRLVLLPQQADQRGDVPEILGPPAEVLTVNRGLIETTVAKAAMRSAGVIHHTEVRPG